MAKWEDEIKDILAKSKWQTNPLELISELLDEAMPMLMFMLALSLSSMVVHSPEGRKLIREALTEQGLTPEQIEHVIYRMIEMATKPWGDRDNGNSS